MKAGTVCFKCSGQVLNGTCMQCGYEHVAQVGLKDGIITYRTQSKGVIGVDYGWGRNLA